MVTDLFLPLVSRQGVAVIKLANLLLTHQPGDRMQPIQQYAGEFGIGVGTVQAALAYLQDIGAVTLDSRGHLGTFVREINYPLIWSLTGQNQIVGGMPLPYSRRYEGLATGLHEAFDQAGVALNLVYTRGSLNRLRALAKGKFDFVVLSRFAFSNAIEYGLTIEEVLDLGSESYVGQHIILLRDHDRDAIEDGARVGIDPSSIDQVLLAKEACHGKDVEFVRITYMNLMAAMQRGQIDATVWNQDDFYASSYPFKAVPLARQDLAQTRVNTEAVIAVEAGNQLVLRTLRSIIKPDLVCDIQKQVMENKLIPIY
jgi:ABC-type amino acid transport substrate-binding protein